MKVNWTKELPTEAGFYWLHGEGDYDLMLVKVYKTFDTWYFVEFGESPCEPNDILEYIKDYGCWWYPAELPDPPDSVL